MVANNAGVPLGGPLADLSRDEIDRALDINLEGRDLRRAGGLSATSASAPGSRLLNTASAAALYGFPNQSIYGATKAGVRSLTETLDGEWGPQGIKVRSLMPSFIDTPLLAASAQRGQQRADPPGGGRCRARVHPGRGSGRAECVERGARRPDPLRRGARPRRSCASPLGWMPGTCARGHGCWMRRMRRRAIRALLSARNSASPAFPLRAQQRLQFLPTAL